MRAQNEHGAARFRSCYFCYFLCECIDKMNKKVHNKFTNEYRRIQEHGFAGYFARSTEKRGVNPRRRNGTVRCMFFPTAQQRGHSRERGRLCGKNGLLPHAPSQDIRFLLFLAAFPPERMRVHKNVCTKV